MLIQDIVAKSVTEAHFDETAFEEFVGLLLRNEVRARLPGSDVRGPTKRKKSDGGRDIVVEITGAPSQTRDQYGAALTWDDQGQTWYSCKCGPTWYSTGVSRDFKAGARKKAEGKAATDGSLPKVPQKDRPVRAMLEHLSAKGRYVIVTDQAEGDDARTKLDSVADNARFWLQVEGLPVPRDLRSQLELITANEIADHLRHHRPNLPVWFRDPLRIDLPDGLQSWDQWGDELRERGDWDYVSDPRREALASATLGQAENNLAFHVVGPPGVGKTRGAYEALQDLADVSARVMYTDVPAQGRAAVTGRALRGTERVAIVIDEVRAGDIEELVSGFRANLKRSILVLVGTSDFDPDEAVPPGVTRFPLEQLGLPERRALAAQVLGIDPLADDERLASVVHLAEGYPLFLVKLAEALAIDQEVLARGTDDTSRWAAAQRVIAGPKADYRDVAAWERESEIRGKCLLVVIMTGRLGLSWHDVWGPEGSPLAHAILEQSDWERVRDADVACRTRQIVRKPDPNRHYRYVSPRNLARIVLNHFVGRPDGGLPAALAKHTPQYVETLLEVARDVSATPALERLAEATAFEFCRRAASDVPATLAAIAGGALYLAARVRPADIARAITDVVLGWSDETFESALSVRASIRGTLQHLTHRRLDRALFARLEQALFRMASSEFESWGNNATGIWSSLFNVVLHQTHRPWAERLGLIRAHLSSEHAKDRLLALKGLDAAVAANEGGLGFTEHDLDDGQWPQPKTLEEVRNAKLAAWALLLEGAEDPDQSVAAAARSGIVSRLRGALARHIVRAGDGVLERLETLAHSWSRSERTALGDCLHEVWAYDKELLSNDDLELVGRIEHALSPVDFGERLSNQLGTWHPGPLPLDASERRIAELAGDDELIGDVVRDPPLLLNELDWLATEEAVRAPAFLHRLGAKDAGRVFLPHLERRHVAGMRPSFLAPYLTGWGHEAGFHALEPWLDAHMDDPVFAETIASVLARLEPSDEVVERISSIIEQTQIPSTLLLPLAFSIERSPVSVGALTRLVAAMSSYDAALDAALPIAAAVMSKQLDPERSTEVCVLATETLRRASKVGIRSATAEVAWEKLGRQLAAEGRADAVAEAAMMLLLAKRGSVRVEKFLSWMAAAGHTREVWRAVSTVLQTEGVLRVEWPLNRIDFGNLIPAELMLDWVGDDEKRGRMLARLAGVHGPDLGDLPRRLLTKFGPEGSVAHALEARALSTPRVVHDLVDFYESQREHALSWRQDPNPEVAAWADTVVASLDHSIATEKLREEADTRYA